jgi:hypothetical protein
MPEWTDFPEPSDPHDFYWYVDDIYIDHGSGCVPCQVVWRGNEFDGIYPLGDFVKFEPGEMIGLNAKFKLMDRPEVPEEVNDAKQS